ncbi:MAG: DUF4435 domain-containing protein [Firmicutes bacterium]|jgi:hypothetical protein|nr:DUF4435 domain-containing protein [Bacillota bacterium]
MLKVLKNARNKGVVAFNKFVLDSKEYASKLFCFYEGEDGKYYNPRNVDNSKYDYEDLISYDCGGKKQVEKAYKLISKTNKYSYTRTAFFIDRDFSLYDNIDDDKIYETPFYSVENFYTDEKVLINILITEFNVNVSNVDYYKIVSDFRERREEFHKHVTNLNAWMYLVREYEKENKSKRFEFAEVKLNKFFKKIQIDKLELKEEICLENIEKIFPDAPKIRREDLKKLVERNNGIDKGKYFRGKNELEFFKSIVNDLRMKNKNNTYFEEKRACVRIDPNSNTLSVFSKYAITTDCLRNYISNVC